ncbi:MULTISPECIES: hypothetical protein [Thalassotalea]|uniref:Tetratricopeptide repeat protein n=1 Tax=Thalassotalea castellviae TaxID=3075612 RepID=A0ABU2ZXC1_9GAMM|nr:hypothetical protein [Thalassotalea sp. W431]MDT0602576.1 hypothetical protein [Thalassotalea sp. W431]
MKFSIFYSLLFASLILVNEEVYANSKASKSAQQNIHHICESSYDLCLSLLPPYLAKSPKYSRLWYAYKLYQLEALFALERDEELEKMLLTVVSRKDLPEKFHIYSYILYAKLIQYKGDTELANRYFNEAKELLLAVNKEWPKPFELIKVANMLLYMNQYQIGYDMLLGLEEKFSHFTDANFKYRLYTNLGHFALRLQDHPAHQEYRLKALQWAEKTDNTNMQAIANFNVARSHYFVDSFDVAIKYFNLALTVSLKARNQSLVDKTYLNLADIYHRLNNRNNVKVLLKKVNFDDLDGVYAKLYTQLSNDN